MGVVFAGSQYSYSSFFLPDFVAFLGGPMIGCHSLGVAISVKISFMKISMASDQTTEQNMPL